MLIYFVVYNTIMAKIVIHGYRCERCGHQWVPREEGSPKVCPKCKSPYWDRPRNKHAKKVVETINFLQTASNKAADTLEMDK